MFLTERILLVSLATTFGGWHDQQKCKANLGKCHLKLSKIKGKDPINKRPISIWPRNSQKKVKKEFY